MSVFCQIFPRIRHVEEFCWGLPPKIGGSENVDRVTHCDQFLGRAKEDWMRGSEMTQRENLMSGTSFEDNSHFYCIALS